MFITRAPKYFQLHLLAMESNGKPGRTTHKYSLEEERAQNLSTKSTSTSISKQQVKPQNKKKNKNKKKKKEKRTVVICTKGARFFVVKFVFLFQIDIANPSCIFLLQIHIVNSYCKGLSYLLIANDCNCNASLVNVAH